MKKFRNGDIIYNAIKAYPKVRFLVNSGSVYYNNDSTNEGFAKIFDFLRGIPTPGVLPDTPDCIIITEGLDPIITQNEYYLQVENCVEGGLFLLTEDNQPLLNEANIGITPE